LLLATRGYFIALGSTPLSLYQHMLLPPHE